MPTAKGLDEFQKYADILEELVKNYNKSIRFISGLTAPCEKYTPIINEILAKDKEIREEIGSDTTKDI